ncbi:glycoside hydrolase family 16 protein [Georgenia sp. AZ-5]|uniref:glycoside hydrolase family 16 protein n=1 Tax=Georgenia sp. AZ-5 TaxID=3367526 RepID=UPI003754E068
MSGTGTTSSRPLFEPDFADDFSAPTLDPGRWVAHYLPHWTTPERSAARFDLDAHGLRLRIDADQPAWRPENGPMRVSNIQTGTWSGPVGSGAGQHRQQPGLRVRTAQPTRHLWTPSHGRVEVTARASPDPACMLGIWLVGFEEASPEQAGEICLAELFGNAIGPAGSTVRLGIKAHHDPRLTTDMADLTLPIDATGEHTYAAEWDDGGVRIFVDGDPVGSFAQRLDYPLQLMIDLFEFPSSGERNPADYPKTAVIRSVRGFRVAPGR